MKISISSINFNGAEKTIKLLESLKNQTNQNFDVIVVDNDSALADFGELKTWIEVNYPKTWLIRNTSNTGFSGGVNTGIRKGLEIGSDWVVLLNNDTWVEKDFIEKLEPLFAHHHGIIALPMDENEEGIAMGGHLQWLKARLSHGHGYIKDRRPDLNKKSPVRYAIGGGMAIHKSILDQVGYFDENYFLYFEDTDYSVRAMKDNVPMIFPAEPLVHHGVSASTRQLGIPTLLHYHYRNALYFNFKNGPWYVKLLVWPWSWWIIIKQSIKILISRKATESRYIISGVFDFYARRMGRIEPHKLRVGIECESIEGKNPMWGIGRIILKLLEEIAARPELAKRYRFVLYFKDSIPKLPCLAAPIFEKKLAPVPGFANQLFPIYYLILLPIKLWSENLDLMFWSAYMLPFFTFTKSFSLMTEDVYYEAFHGTLPLRNRFFYAIWGTYSAKFSTKLMAISETSKKHIAKLYKIDDRRIVVNYLGIDINNSVPNIKNLDLKIGNYLLYIGQAFPRRHLRETILAFEKIASNCTDLQFIAIGPDKYETSVIEPLVKEVNKRLNREAIIHKDYVTDDELLELYSGAKALVYVSDREAFGLPPMEALSFGVPPVLADNDLGRELFGEYAFYTQNASPEGIAASMREALSNKEKIDKIRTYGSEFAAKYSWKNFTDGWLEIIRKMK